LTANMRSNSASLMSVTGLLTWATPALFTRMSIRSQATSVERIAASISAGFDTAQPSARDLLRRGGIDVEHRDTRALAHVGLGDDGAHAGSGTGDDRDLVGKTHGTH